MSLEQIAESYRRISDEITHALPADWQRAWVQVEHDDYSCSVACFASGLDTSIEPRFIDMPNSLFKAFRQLRQECRETTNGAWSTATVILEPEKFRIEFGYDPVPIEGELERRRTWKKKYLP